MKKNPHCQLLGLRMAALCAQPSMPNTDRWCKEIGPDKRPTDDERVNKFDYLEK